MAIELTVEQGRAIDTTGGTLPSVIDPNTHVEYVLIRKDEYETVAQALEEDRRERAIRECALKDAAVRLSTESKPTESKPS